MVSCIAVSSDSHHAELLVEADFADFVVYPPAAYAQFSNELGDELKHRPAPLATLLAALFGTVALLLGGLWFWMRWNRNSDQADTD